MSDRTCEERITEELDNTEWWLAERYELIDAANQADDWKRQDELREEIEPYAVDVKHVLKLELSGGGPASWLEVGLEKERWGVTVVSVTYHFADWFDHAERDVSETEAPDMWRLAEYYAESAECYAKQASR